MGVKYIAFATAFIVFMVAPASCAKVDKRVLPTNEQCDPNTGTCRKGDWVAEHIADCKYDRSLSHPFSCDAQNDQLGSWIVDVAKGDRCVPSSGGRFRCGDPGTNTRCVCSDSNIHRAKTEYFNRCRCQYWPLLDVGANEPAFCTGYYTGGASGVHHWACCNNCNDTTANSCIGRTWQGGSSFSYCEQCGRKTAAAGGREKYFFNCGSCTNQETCARRCNKKGYDVLGLCWEWLDCFKGCCIESNTQPRITKRQTNDIMTFCGDGVCTDRETQSSCPIDCCYQVNSICNTTECAPSCCGSPYCCLAVGEIPTSSQLGICQTTLHPSVYLVLVLILAFI